MFLFFLIATSPTSLENLEFQIPTDLEGNPPLYITRKRKGGQDAIYINNAQVLRGRADLMMKNQFGGKQYLHVIEEVLQPLTVLPRSSLENSYSLTAFQMITHSESLDLGSHQIKQFGKIVMASNKGNVFRSNGFHTYFMPVDEGFKPPPRSDLFDAKVIDAHIIPDRVIFTAAASLNDPLETLTFEDNLKVQVTFFTEGEGKHTKCEFHCGLLITDTVIDNHHQPP